MSVTQNSDCPILVADNDPFVRLGISVMLEDAGLNCKTADGKTAAVALVDEGFTPALLMTDQEMDDGSGFELAEELLRRLPDMKVLLISGDDAVKDTLPSEWHFLGKPFLARELYDKIHDILPRLTFADLRY